MKLIGTQLKELLERVKITPENYQALKARLGLEPQCNCDVWVDILDQTHRAWKELGWEAARNAYTERYEWYFAKPR